MNGVSGTWDVEGVMERVTGMWEVEEWEVPSTYGKMDVADVECSVFGEAMLLVLLRKEVKG